MLLHEVLARTRMREDQRRAREIRLARRLASARRRYPLVEQGALLAKK